LDENRSGLLNKYREKSAPATLKKATQNITGHKLAIAALKASCHEG